MDNSKTMTYEEWMNEIESYGTRFERFLNEWDNGMDVNRMEEWLKAAYNLGLEHGDMSKCHCYNCADSYSKMSRMIVCPTCGNKRCPKATDHHNECTNSNEPGQKGSRYEKFI